MQIEFPNLSYHLDGWRFKNIAEQKYFMQAKIITPSGIKRVIEFPLAILAVTNIADPLSVNENKYSAIHLYVPRIDGKGDSGSCFLMSVYKIKKRTFSWLSQIMVNPKDRKEVLTPFLCGLPFIDRKGNDLPSWAIIFLKLFDDVSAFFKVQWSGLIDASEIPKCGKNVKMTEYRRLQGKQAWYEDTSDFVVADMNIYMGFCGEDNLVFQEEARRLKILQDEYLAHINACWSAPIRDNLSDGCHTLLCQSGRDDPDMTVRDFGRKLVALIDQGDEEACKWLENTDDLNIPCLQKWIDKNHPSGFIDMEDGHKSIIRIKLPVFRQIQRDIDRPERKRKAPIEFDN